MAVKEVNAGYGILVYSIGNGGVELVDQKEQLIIFILDDGRLTGHHLSLGGTVIRVQLIVKSRLPVGKLCGLDL